MITEDLIQYIKSQLEKNITKDLIIFNLLRVGWKREDVDEGFSKIESSIISSSPEIKTDIEIDEMGNTQYQQEDSKGEESKDIEQKTQTTPESSNNEDKSVDPYREMPDGLDIEQANPYNPVKEEIKEPAKTESTEAVVSKEEVKPVENHFTSTSVLEPVKIWTPISIKPKIEDKIEFSKEKNIETYNLELQGEKQSVPSSFEAPREFVDKDEEPKTPDLIPVINKTPFAIPVSQHSIKKEINSGNISSSVKDFPSIQQNLPPKKPSYVQPSVVSNGMVDIVPRNAMISSYSQDILAATKEEEVTPVNRRRRLFKLGILILVIALIGGMVFAFVEGNLKIPWSNFSFAVVKKDPKTIMINAPSTIANLKSYKVETNINISSPSLSNITTGLASGEVVTSKDRDSISINTKGIASHTSGNLVFDYLLNFESSILEKEIVSNLKYNGDDFFITVPELDEVLKKDAPDPTTVSFKTNQIPMVIEEFSPSVQDLVKKIDVYDIVSGKIPLYVKNEVASIFKDFIGALQYVEKGKESIHGVETYHYEMTADRQLTKKFLVSLSDLFMTSLSAEQKKELDETLGSSSISSFDVWVGINDDNIYQIKFTLNTPLSKVLGLNDSGIAGNEVKLDWTTTYYDLDVPNDIALPNGQVSMDVFVKKIKDLKVKNIISSFKPQTVSLRNAIGSYGLRSNPTGSCTNPNPGSLFSPQGHTKAADGAISSISKSMNSLLSVTSGAGACYSTSTAWALAAPLFASSSDSSLTNSFYCTDSTGNITTVNSPLTGTVCK